MLSYSISLGNKMSLARGWLPLIKGQIYCNRRTKSCFSVWDVQNVTLDRLMKLCARRSMNTETGGSTGRKRLNCLDERTFSAGFCGVRFISRLSGIPRKESLSILIQAGSLKKNKNGRRRIRLSQPILKEKSEIFSPWQKVRMRMRQKRLCSKLVS